MLIGIITLLDGTQAVVQSSHLGTDTIVFPDHIVHILVHVNYLADGSGNGSGAALGSLIGLGKFLQRNWTSLNLHAQVAGNLLQTHVGD